MPPRTRATKDLKENVENVKKNRVKSDGKVTKPPRRALADKTNSLSDDNVSIDVPLKTSKAVLKNKAATTVSKNGIRPRRDRRLPTRYVENEVLNNLSNNKENPEKNQNSINSVASTPSKPTSTHERVEQNPTKTVVKENRTRVKRTCRIQSVKGPPATKSVTPTKLTICTSSPFKTPQSLDSSLITNRPRRICRLPSKFEDHSSSPSKFIPVLPCHASTPIAQKSTKTQSSKSHDNVAESDERQRPTRKEKGNAKKDVKNTKGIDHYFSKSQTNKTLSISKDKTSPDTNNNPKSKRIIKKVNTKSPTKQISPKANIKTGFTKRLLENNLSFRVFEDRESQDKNSDIYEFTFDPNEEPPPQKKKRKRVVKKRPPKPKTVVLKNNYDNNVQKALESLKSKVKPSQSQNTQSKPQAQGTQPQNEQTNTGKIKIIENIVIKPAAENKSLNYTPALPVNDSVKSIHLSNYASIHVEDIAADFEITDNNINYSPVNSPCHPVTPEGQINNSSRKTEVHVNNKDPLNLHEDMSFFDGHPVASSSMNVSVRDPLASPWRVEFGNLPIRWQANTYVKPNMTPAVESSFINSEEISKKKHVYTNMVTEEPLPQIEDPPNLKQTSIISFMKEVAERSLKKKRGRSISPKKTNSLFEESNCNFGYETPKKARKEKVATPSNDKSCERETSAENLEHSNENSHPGQNHNQSEESLGQKSKKNKDGTFFGFDESCDQENMSPIKNVRHTRARRFNSKSRAVLQEINAVSGPTRPLLPLIVGPKPTSEVVEKLYEQLKTAESAPQLLEKQNLNESVNNDEPSLSDDDDDGQSVHLFEDVEVVHHMKPQRKSYGKSKKVTFRQRSNSDSDLAQAPDARVHDDDDLADLTFQMPNVKEKKVKKKKSKMLMSKKEEKEVEEWAAGFNSMCEDVDEFSLVFE